MLRPVGRVPLLALVVALTLATLAPQPAQAAPASQLGDGAPAALDPADALRQQQLQSPSFRLLVPFRTQKDGGRWQSSNCGPATLGMLLDGFGIPDHTTDDLRVPAHTYQGTLGMRPGTGLEHIAHVAEDLGIRTHGLYTADGSYRRWSVADVEAELRQGRPVMPLVRLHLVPGYEAMAPRWGHYILLTGRSPEGFTFSDSLKTDPEAGTTGLISARQLEQAMASSHIPGQAVAFSGPRPLPIRLPGG